MPPHPSGNRRDFSPRHPQRSATALKQADSPFQEERRPRGTSSCKATPLSQALPPPTSLSHPSPQARSSKQRPEARSLRLLQAPTTSPVPRSSRTPSRRLL